MRQKKAHCLLHRHPHPQPSQWMAVLSLQRCLLTQNALLLVSVAVFKVAYYFMLPITHPAF